MNLSRPVIEVGIAVAIVIVVLILQPGVAVGGIVALVVLAVCGVTLLVARRRQPRARSRGRPARATPRGRPAPERARTRRR